MGGEVHSTEREVDQVWKTLSGLVLLYILPAILNWNFYYIRMNYFTEPASGGKARIPMLAGS